MKEIRALIRPRHPLSHKGMHGHALLIAGNEGKMGASVLAAKGCLRTGAGLLTVNVPKAERYILQTAIPEAMLQWRENGIEAIEKFSAVGIGPGMGTGADDYKLMAWLFDHYNSPIVIDADALTMLSQHKEIWRSIPIGSILTPHPKEFDRMFGEHDDNEQRKVTAIRISKEYPWVIILKTSSTTVVANSEYYTNDTGNAGLAKGGTGDVLCGMVTSLLAQGYHSYDAARAGVYLHGLAADLAIKDQSMESLLATDVTEYIGKAFASLLKIKMVQRPI